MVKVRRWRDFGGKSLGKRGGQRQGQACTNETQKSVNVCTRFPVTEETYLQRLNKTSLCQTKQGMAGHSLCGGGGRGQWRGGGRGMRRWEVGEEGGEKDRSMSFTWKVCHTSQWSETWEVRAGWEEREHVARWEGRNACLSTPACMRQGWTQVGTTRLLDIGRAWYWCWVELNSRWDYEAQIINSMIKTDLMILISCPIVCSFLLPKQLWSVQTSTSSNRWQCEQQIFYNSKLGGGWNR